MEWYKCPVTAVEIPGYVRERCKNCKKCKAKNIGSADDLAELEAILVDIKESKKIHDFLTKCYEKRPDYIVLSQDYLDKILLEDSSAVKRERIYDIPIVLIQGKNIHKFGSKVKKREGEVR